jgi:ATP-dependent helicase HrpB
MSRRFGGWIEVAVVDIAPSLSSKRNRVLSLPVDRLLPEIVSALHERNSLVLEAPPGAGKTTRVSPALLEAGFGEILVLEPRRLAARLAARRVAEEHGEAVGETVGYQVRFESVAGPRTRLRFLTEGVLTRRLLADPELRGVGAVVLDEFHERHLEGDLALALLRRLQQTKRPELRLIVMSATLHGEGLAEFLDDAPRLRSEGRLYPIAVEYTPHSSEPLEEKVAAAARRLLREQSEGDILVFLPGAAEIRRCQRACASLASRDLMVLPLHGDLSPEEQDRAVLPSCERRIILSTNVAESSITIEGVRAVIDSGLARVPTEAPWTGLPRVDVARIARASAVQRAGRAGRVGPGRAIRLYPEDDFLRRPEFDSPEILRRELAQLCLDLHAAGVEEPGTLPWLNAPPKEAVDAAEELLKRLGALSPQGHITAVGRRMAVLPLHPRLARLVLAAEERGAGEEACAAAAVLSVGARLPDQLPHPTASDVFLMMETALDGFARRHHEQLRRMVRPRTRGAGDEALLKALLEAFPDRVARRSGAQYRLSAGASAQLARNSAQQGRALVVAVDIEDRPDLGPPLIRVASAVEPEWLLELFPDRVLDRSELVWNQASERVEQSDALLYDSLVIDETRSHTPDPERAAILLAGKAMEAGLHRFCDAEAFEAFRRRAEFAASQGVRPEWNDDLTQVALRSLCRGLHSFAELRNAGCGGGLERAVLHAMGEGAARQLDAMAPERVRLPSGRQTRVFYAPGQAPWVASRLQDFFGLRETPRVAQGRVPVVVHLLAPNHRPVQMTSDLEGFWARLYPQVRKELMRRYPKHAWPENPYTAGKR